MVGISLLVNGGFSYFNQDQCLQNASRYLYFIHCGTTEVLWEAQAALTSFPLDNVSQIFFGDHAWPVSWPVIPLVSRTVTQWFGTVSSTAENLLHNACHQTHEVFHNILISDSVDSTRHFSPHNNHSLHTSSIGTIL